jgi:hypothetical protein
MTYSVFKKDVMQRHLIFEAKAPEKNGTGKFSGHGKLFVFKLRFLDKKFKFLRNKKLTVQSLNNASKIVRTLFCRKFVFYSIVPGIS